MSDEAKRGENAVEVLRCAGISCIPSRAASVGGRNCGDWIP